MTEEQIGWMKSAKSESEWNDACDKVKAAHGGQYPADWFAKIIISGIAATAQRNFK